MVISQDLEQNRLKIIEMFYIPYCPLQELYSVLKKSKHSLQWKKYTYTYFFSVIKFLKRPFRFLTGS